MPNAAFTPIMPWRSLRRTACVVGLALALGGCGYKGPLYMPPPPPAPDDSLTTPPSSPQATPAASAPPTVHDAPQ